MLGKLCNLPTYGLQSFRKPGANRCRVPGLGAAAVSGGTRADALPGSAPGAPGAPRRRVGQHRGPQTRTAPGAAAGLPAGPQLLIVPGADPQSGGHGAACTAATAPQAAQRDPAPGPLPTAGPPAAAGLATVPPPTWLNLSTMPRQVEHARRRRSPAPRAGGSIQRTAQSATSSGARTG